MEARQLLYPWIYLLLLGLAWRSSHALGESHGKLLEDWEVWVGKIKWRGCSYRVVEKVGVG